MTTKTRIIAGFSLLIVILSVVAGVGYKNLENASIQFSHYNQVSQLNTVASDLIAALYLLEDKSYQYLDTKTPAHMDAAAVALATAEQKVAEAEKLISKPTWAEWLRQIKGHVTAMRTPMEKVRTDTKNAYDQYMTVVRPNILEFEARLLELAAFVHEIQNTDMLYQVTRAESLLGTVRFSLARFAETRHPDDGAAATKALDALTKHMNEIKVNLRTDNGRRLYGESMTAYERVTTAFAAMVQGFAATNQGLNALRDNLASVQQISNTLNGEVDTEANAEGPALLRANQNAQTAVLSISGVGIAAGLILAFIIVASIIKVLGEMSAFASAISKGNFGYAVNIREKGEIGAMVEGMKQIPGVLTQLVEKTTAMADNVSSGHLRDTLSPDDFPGDFAGIAKGVNTVGAAYGNLLDTLSSPIMAADKNNNILYLNKSGQTALGGNYTKEPCRTHLNAPECGTKNCFGVCAMEQNKPFQGETRLTVRGKHMDVAVDSLPLHNLKNAVVGYVEILTDLTDMKAKQAAVMNAVAEASEVSDRVAAASEELSAQVEQISRGAEMQRDRVNSTATAMEEMNATVLEVAQSAGHASEQSDGTRQKAETGAQLVNKVVASIHMVNSVAASLQGNMQELGKQAEGIGGVMNVISDIADQTNLLALNAAIEAARAGEAGRGFAVVADEVRKLAEKTMLATQEVGSNISAIQSSAQANITAVGEAVKNINIATDLANSSGSALKEIVDLAAANSAVVASIATAAEEQSATSEEINHSIDEINRIVGETSEGMVQSSAAVQDLSQMAQELRRIMERLVKPTQG